jgi:hypothetical protein
MVRDPHHSAPWLGNRNTLKNAKGFVCDGKVHPLNFHHTVADALGEHVCHSQPPAMLIVLCAHTSHS